jgi:histone-lysine N-methyltransferase SETD8
VSLFQDFSRDFFTQREIFFSVDATSETARKGRLVNHSRNCNLIAKALAVDGVPRLLLIAKNDIDSGSELTLDYGDRSKKSLKAHPWLAM